jgi:tRNA (cytidine/uridine-2'-O-)-methyltransferase
MALHIVLFEPEIPQNTGNIARTCAATGAELHLVHPLGFSIEDKQVKRAGLDYWHLLTVHEYKSIEHFLSVHGDKPLWLATTKATDTYCDVAYGEETFMAFGKESAGIPEEILVRYPNNCVRIPMVQDARSLNLSNSVAIMAYEYLRQRGFSNLQKQGALHRLAWPKDSISIVQE